MTLLHTATRTLRYWTSHRPLSTQIKRLAELSNHVKWIVGDITQINLQPAAYDVWHDRAVFHFLTVALTYLDMDWDWLARNAKLCDRQNRLGFAVSLASEVADARGESEKARNLRERLAVVERGRLAREDTFCRDSMTNAERVWLRAHRSSTAAHWNLLTDLKGEALAYARE